MTNQRPERREAPDLRTVSPDQFGSAVPHEVRQFHVPVSDRFPNLKNLRTVVGPEHVSILLSKTGSRELYECGDDPRAEPAVKSPGLVAAVTLMAALDGAEGLVSNEWLEYETIVADTSRKLLGRVGLINIYDGSQNSSIAARMIEDSIKGYVTDQDPAVKAMISSHGIPGLSTDDFKFPPQTLRDLIRTPAEFQDRFERTVILENRGDDPNNQHSAHAPQWFLRPLPGGEPITIGLVANPDNSDLDFVPAGREEYQGLLDDSIKPFGVLEITDKAISYYSNEVSLGDEDPAGRHFPRSMCAVIESGGLVTRPTEQYTDRARKLRGYFAQLISPLTELADGSPNNVRSLAAARQAPELFNEDAQPEPNASPAGQTASRQAVQTQPVQASGEQRPRPVIDGELVPPKEFRRTLKFMPESTFQADDKSEVTPEPITEPVRRRPLLGRLGKRPISDNE